MQAGLPADKRMDSDELAAHWRALAIQERYKRRATQLCVHTAIETMRDRWRHQDGEFCAWALWELYKATLDMELPAELIGELELEPSPRGS